MHVGTLYWTTCITAGYPCIFTASSANHTRFSTITRILTNFLFTPRLIKVLLLPFVQTIYYFLFCWTFFIQKLLFSLLKFPFSLVSFSVNTDNDGTSIRWGYIFDSQREIDKQVMIFPFSMKLKSCFIIIIILRTFIHIQSFILLLKKYFDHNFLDSIKKTFIGKKFVYFPSFEKL